MVSGSLKKTKRLVNSIKQPEGFLFLLFCLNKISQFDLINQLFLVLSGESKWNFATFIVLFSFFPNTSEVLSCM